MPNQTETGKAFEYALLSEFFNRLSSEHNKVVIIENDPYDTAKDYFNLFSPSQQGEYRLAASSAINFIYDLEPRLYNSITEDDILQLEIVSDSQGQRGDVRDVLAIRLLQKWEIGVSAKNNHRAVKHSRLSKRIDFGEKWLGIPCTPEYHLKINPIFELLEDYLKQDKQYQWSNVDDKEDRIYLPLLQAFTTEVKTLNDINPGKVPCALVEYLIGNQDFYKVIKSDNEVEIQIFNIHGSLNQSFGDIKPKTKIRKINLPTQLNDISFKCDSKNTVFITFDEGWQLSFRIHNASSKVEPSLKFDINLVSSPHHLIQNHIFLN